MKTNLLPRTSFFSAVFAVLIASQNVLAQEKPVAQSPVAPTESAKPSADVPAACAAFLGSWVGKWTRGNIGETQLRILEVDQDCQAKYSYGSSSRISTAVIKNGSLSFICNSSTGGTCVFEVSGKELTANYSNPAGGINFAYFRKTGP